jgi:outer membrane biosynthesis protein TonB
MSFFELLAGQRTILLILGIAGFFMVLAVGIEVAPRIRRAVRAAAAARAERAREQALERKRRALARQQSKLERVNDLKQAAPEAAPVIAIPADATPVTQVAEPVAAQTQAPESATPTVPTAEKPADPPAEQPAEKPEEKESVASLISAFVEEAAESRYAALLKLCEPVAIDALHEQASAIAAQLRSRLQPEDAS